LVCLFAAGALLSVTPAAVAQDQQSNEDRPIPVPEGTHLRQFHYRPLAGLRKPEGPTAAIGSIPMWGYRIVSPIDGNTYTGVMVGQTPSNRAGSTVVPTVLIPIRLNFQYRSGTTFTFDPTADDPGCLGESNTALSLTHSGPVFNNFDYDFRGAEVGTTQYTDAFQRANFWSDVSTNASYHTLLGLSTLPVQTVTVSSSSHANPNGTVFVAAGQCSTNTGNVNHAGYLGVMNVNFWDPVAQSLITKLGIGPSTFPIFLFYNAVMSVGTPTNLNNCCVLGYHNAVGSPAQTYAVAEFEGRDQTLFTGVADIAALTHEVGEWMDDPLTNNATPAWGHVGQVSTCPANLEVGDPLSGTLFPSVTMNNFTYHPQELAFFSWFFRQTPSIGVNGWYSDNGTFTTDAGAVCH
jgi:hypothetical protein